MTSLSFYFVHFSLFLSLIALSSAGFAQNSFQWVSVKKQILTAKSTKYFIKAQAPVGSTVEISPQVTVLNKDKNSTFEKKYFCDDCNDFFISKDGFVEFDLIVPVEHDFLQIQVEVKIPQQTEALSDVLLIAKNDTPLLEVPKVVQAPIVAKVVQRNVIKPKKSVKKRNLFKYPGELHLLGSAVPARTGINYFTDISAQYFIKQFGFRAMYFENFNSTVVDHIRTTEFSLMYRVPVGKARLGQAVIPSLHYAKVQPGTSTAEFAGVGISYVDDMWIWVKNIFEIIPFLRYPKTVEAHFEYLPVAISPKNTSSISAYVFSMRGYMFLTTQLTVEAGFYFHSVSYSQEPIDFSSQTAFPEIGMGYRF